MRKRGEYKLFSKLNTIIVVTMIAIMVLGVSYGYWSDSLTVNAQISTGKLMVEGVMEYGYESLCEYPRHDQHNNCTFHDWWGGQQDAGNVQLGTNYTANKAPVQVENLTLQLVEGKGQTIGYRGTGDIVFTIKNTGTIPAVVSLNPSETNYEKTWLKFSAPLVGQADGPGDRTTFSQGVIDTTKKQFKVDKGQGFENATLVTDFLLNPSDQATVKIEECELNISEYFLIDKYDLTKARIEAQVSVVFQDATKQWSGNTCNSLFVNIPIEFKYCEECILECKGKTIPLGINLEGVNSCDAYREMYPNENREWHCNNKCGCKKNKIVAEELMRPAPMPEGPEGPIGSVGNPAEDGNMSDLVKPMPMPESPEGPAGSVGNPAEIPIPLPTPLPTPLPMPESPEGPVGSVGNPAMDLPVTLPADEEDIIVGERPTVVPLEPEDNLVVDVPEALPIESQNNLVADMPMLLPLE